MSRAASHPWSTDTNLEQFGFASMFDLARAWQEAGLPQGSGFLDFLLSHAMEKLDFLLSHAMEKSAIQEQKHEILLEVLQQATPSDPMMGALGKEWGGFLYDSFSALALTKGAPPVAALEMDFSNMGAANRVLGRAQVDRSVRIMTAIYRDEIEKAGGQQTAVRLGGDELRYYVTGLSDLALRGVIARAERRVNGLTAALGVDRLRHEKRGDDPVRAGFGVGAAHVMLGEAIDSNDALREQLEVGIEAHKESIGQRRYVAEPKRAWDLVDAEVLRTQLSREQVERVLCAQEDALGLPHAIARPEAPRASIFKDLRQVMARAEGAAYGDVYAARHACAADHHMRLIKGEEFDYYEMMTIQERQLLTHLVNLCNPMDPTTGLKTAASSGKSFEFLRAKPPLSVVELEITNLTGLNAALGHEKANHLIHRYVEKLQADIDNTMEGAPHQLFSIAGTRIRLLVGGQNTKFDAEGVSNYCQAIADDFVGWLGKQPEAGKLAELVNPRRQVIGLDGRIFKEQGIGMRYIVMPTIDTPLDYPVSFPAEPNLLLQNDLGRPDHQLHAWGHFQLAEELAEVYSRWPHALDEHLRASDRRCEPVLLPEEKLLQWYVGGAVWMGDKRTMVQEPHLMQGIPHDLLDAAMRGVRVPRQALPQIVGASPSLEVTGAESVGRVRQSAGLAAGAS